MTPLEILGDIVWHMIPPFGVFGLFILLMRAIIRSDRKERETYAKLEAEMRQARAKTPKSKR